MAIEVPSRVAYPPPGIAESTAAPGATRSGLARPSGAGPRLENSVTRRCRSTAPTVSTSGYGAGASAIEPHDGPVFPAAATTRMPAAVSAAVAGRSAPGSHPSTGGQPHELVSTSGAREGRPSVSGSPPSGNGASMNWRQSR